MLMDMIMWTVFAFVIVAALTLGIIASAQSKRRKRAALAAAATPDNTVGVAPGWYPDTNRPGYQRYWGGSAWFDEWRQDPTQVGTPRDPWQSQN